MAAARCVIFYSWQTDLPGATNRSFIQKALENAVKTIRADESIQVEPVIERDTLGVPGSPDIAETIFGKINQAQIFVGDISIINQSAGVAEPIGLPPWQDYASNRAWQTYASKVCSSVKAQLFATFNSSNVSRQPACTLG